MASASHSKAGETRGRFRSGAGAPELVYDLVLCTDTPNGSPVMLVHGLNSCRAIWTEQVAFLSRHRHVLTVDMRGHGESQQLKSGYTVADYAGDLICLLNELKLGPVHLMGTSVGGMVAQSMAVQEQSLLKSLCLVATADEVSGIDGTALAAAIKEQGNAHVMRPFVEANTFAAGASVALVDAVMKIIAAEPDWLAAQRWQEIAGTGRLTDVETIKLPTLVIHGDRDKTVSLELGLRLAKRITNTAVFVVPFCGHMPFLENPRIFNGVYEEFLYRFDLVHR